MGTISTAHTMNLSSADLAQQNAQNWSKSAIFSAAGVAALKSEAEVCELVTKAPCVKALGTRHSFSTIADTFGLHTSLSQMNKVLEINRGAMTVTVQPSTRYGELARELYRQRLSLANFGSLLHISVGGATSTATHGSGEENGNLSTAVRALKIVGASGNVRTFRADASDKLNFNNPFYGAVVNYGALGVTTEITLKIEEAFRMRQDVFLNLPFDKAVKHFNQIQKLAYSVSFFTDWCSLYINQVWFKTRLDRPLLVEPSRLLLTASAAERDMNPIVALSGLACTPLSAARRVQRFAGFSFPFNRNTE